MILGWKKAIAAPFSNGCSFPGIITVVIAARNEATTIGKLLHGLLEQEDKSIEIIVVDDHSDDHTGAVVQQMIDSGNNGLRLLQLTQGEGKKRALQLGIEHARGAVIVTTDADCAVNPQWIITIRHWFADENIHFVYGGVRIRENGSFFASLQSVEWNSLIGTGVATLALGFPSMCNGANLAFRKSTFYEVGGYEGNYHLASGDDEFLLRKVFARYPQGIRFNNIKTGVVTTEPVSTLKALFHQRVRWAGKWGSHNKLGSMTLALFIFSFHLAMVIMLPWLFGAHGVVLLASYILLKTVPEYIYLSTVAQFLGMRWRWFAFLFLQLIYSFYVVFFGVLANKASFEWKGRKQGITAVKITSSFPGNR